MAPVDGSARASTSNTGHSGGHHGRQERTQRTREELHRTEVSSRHTLEGNDVEYGYSFEDGTERLQAHMLDVKRHAPEHVVIPNGSDDYGWDAWQIIEPIFKHSRSESNRVYQMVANLIKASARLNFQQRDTVTYRQRVPSGGTKKRTAVIAGPQDVANVCRCLETLRSTTHEVGPRKRSVVDAIKTKSGDDNTVEGLEPIIEYLEESDASQVNLPELKNILDDLEEDYLIVRDGDEITARNWDALGEPRIEQHAHLFEDTVDPITQEPFLDSWSAYRDEATTTAGDMMGETEISSSGAGLPEEDTSQLLADSEVADDMAEWEQAVLERVYETMDGERVQHMSDLPVEGFVGLTELDDPDLSSVDSRETILDPAHDAWDVDDKPDEWVSSETDARQQIQQLITELLGNDVISVAHIHERRDNIPVDVTIEVNI